MGKKSSSKAEVVDPSGSVRGQRAGSVRKAAHHEGEAGQPASEGATKWRGAAGGRDPVGEKEPGKSRGPGG
jgi:hypothetical protein